MSVQFVQTHHSVVVATESTIDHTHALTLYQEALHPATEEQVSQWTVQKVIARVGANLLVRWDGDWVDSLIPIAGNEVFAEQIGIGFEPVSSEEEGEEE